MDLEDFTRKLRAARSQIAAHQSPSSARDEEAARVLEELQTAWEELSTAEEELREQNEELVHTRLEAENQRRRYEELFEFAPDAYLVTDVHGVIREANRAAVRLLGIDASRIGGKPLASFVEPAQRREFRAQLGRIAQVEGPHEVNVCIAPREAATFDGSFRTAPILSANGERLGYRWMLRDVSARQQAEEGLRRHRDALEESVAERTAELRAANAAKDALLTSEQAAREHAEAANRAKDAFLATLSHELRTPLTALVGWIHILRQRGLDDETRTRAVDVIERSARSQVRLIEEILDVSRIIAGKLALEPRMVELAPLVETAVGLLRPSAQEKGLSLRTTIEAGPLPVLVDSDRLQQVLWNVVSNAIKFTPNGGKIEVEVTRVGNGAEVRVRDSGRGIGPEFLPHVFDRFRQADASTTRSYGGLGIGLAIAQHLVERHGGTIRAESAGLGHGSTFIVTLPLQNAAAPEWPPGLERRQRPRPAFVATQTVRVLVVDDDRDSREVLETALRQAGMEVTTAASTPDALEKFRLQRPDVVVSDIAMPEQDGCVLIRTLRGEQGGYFGALAITGYARDDVDRAARQAGFDECFVKPISMPDLAAAVAALAVRSERSQ